MEGTWVTLRVLIASSHLLVDAMLSTRWVATSRSDQPDHRGRQGSSDVRQVTVVEGRPPASPWTIPCCSEMKKKGIAVETTTNAHHPVEIYWNVRTCRRSSASPWAALYPRTTQALPGSRWLDGDLTLPGVYAIIRPHACIPRTCHRRNPLVHNILSRRRKAPALMVPPACRPDPGDVGLSRRKPRNKFAS